MPDTEMVQTKIWVLVIDSKYGTAVTAHPSRAALDEALYDYCDEWWGREFGADLRPGADNLVASYWDRMSDRGGEWHVIEECEMPSGNLDAAGARAAAEAICDYADNNLSMFEACSEEDPVKARQIFEAAKALRDLLNGKFPAPATPSAAQLREALQNCLDCVTAAEAEGLHEIIASLRGRNDDGESGVSRLIDLVQRRLLWVRDYAEPALAATAPAADKVVTQSITNVQPAKAGFIGWDNLETELLVVVRELAPGEHITHFTLSEAGINYFVAPTACSEVRNTSNDKMVKFSRRDNETEDEFARRVIATLSAITSRS